MSTHARSPTAELSTLKTISIVLAFTAAVGLTLGTAGFSAIDADRGISVSVVEDEEAYLGVETFDPLVDGESTTMMEIENRFDAELDEIRVTTSESAVKEIDAPDEIGIGQTVPVDVVVQCEERDQVDIEFDVTATTDGVTVDTTVTDTFECLTTGDRPGVAFFGVGNAEVRGPPGVFDGGLNVTVKTTEDEFDLTRTESGERIRSGGSGSVSGQIQAVGFEAFDVREENPFRSE